MSLEEQERLIEKEKRLLEKMSAADEQTSVGDKGEFDDDLDDWFYNTDEKDERWAE